MNKKQLIFSENNLKQLSLEDLINKQTTIADYKFGEQLGKGRYAIVYEAVHIKSKQKVAIKRIPKNCSYKNYFKKPDIESFLKKDQVDTSDEDLRFLREIQSHDKVKGHKNIVELYKVINTPDDVINLVMEFVAGGTLSEFINERTNSKNNSKDKIHQQKELHMCEIWYIFKQILEGLSYMHLLDVSHRDLKPDNILLTYDRQVKIADFGVSVSLPFYEKNKQIFLEKDKYLYTGTYLFFSPQRAASRLIYCPYAADMWSAGVILYYMLSGGEFLFKERALLPLLKKIENAEFEFSDKVNDLDKDLLHLLNSLLQKEESERISASDALKHPWIHNNEERYLKEIKLLNKTSPLAQSPESPTISDDMQVNFERESGNDILNKNYLPKGK